MDSSRVRSRSIRYNRPATSGLSRFNFPCDEPIAKQKGSVIQAELISCDISVEAYSLKRILTNLLDNAIKYGPDNQRVEVESKLDPVNNHYQLIITDQGPGIPASEFKNIWQPYYRLSIESHKAISGTGIGLYLVKQLAEKNMAKVWVESNYADQEKLKSAQSGCRFILEWSLSEIDQEALL